MSDSLIYKDASGANQAIDLNLGMYAEAAEAKVNVCRGSAMCVCLAVNDDHADSVAGVLPAVPHSR